MDYGYTKTPSMHRRLGCATLSQLAFTGDREGKPEFAMREIPMGQCTWYISAQKISICAPARFHKVAAALPLKQFQSVLLKCEVRYDEYVQLALSLTADQNGQIVKDAHLAFSHSNL